MTEVRCSYWELGAIVRHEKQRHDDGKVRGALGRRKFSVPAFVTTRRSGLDDPEDPAAVLSDAQARIRQRGWIEPDGQLADQPYEIVTALAHASTYGFLQIGDPDEDEVRVVLALQQRLAFRVWMCRDEVFIDEVHPDSAWQALLAYLPDAAVAEGRPVSVSTSLLSEAAAAADQHRGEQDRWLAHELRARGVAATQADALGRFNRMSDRKTMQLAVAGREPNGTLYIGSEAINLHHCPSGRVAMIPQPDEASTVMRPADPKTIATAAEQLARQLARGLS